MASPSLAARGQRLGLRAIAKLGGLSAMADPRVRATVERLLAGAAHQGFRAQLVAGRAFAPKPGSGAAVRTEPVRPRGLFDLTPTEDQAMLQAAAKELADEVLRPAGAQADTGRAVPATVRAAAAEMGLHVLGVPVGLDGIAEEASAVASCLVVEELARGDLGLAVGLLAPAAVATVLAAYGSPEQQATYLPHFTGEAPVPVAALVLQEPQPLFDALAPRTTGRVTGDRIVLNGTKALVPGADSAELLVVSALVDGEPRLAIIDAGVDGLSHEDDPAMGIRAARTGRLILEDVTVARSALLGTTQDHADVVRRARLAWSAAAVGVAQATLDQLVPYTTTRKAFGEPIAHRQAVAFAVADIAIELEALRLVVWKAAARLDAGTDAADLVAKARALAATHGAMIGSQAVQLLGGHGFVKDWDNERWYRDLRGAGLLEGVLVV